MVPSSAVLSAALALALTAAAVLGAPGNNEEDGSVEDTISIQILNQSYPGRLPGPGECGVQNSVPGSGGSMHYWATEMELREFPWVAMLLDKSGNNCSGALISKRYVVASANCSAGKTLVRLGEHDVTKIMDCGTDPRNGETVCIRAVEIAVENITIHPDYKTVDDHPTNDIALVRLSRDVDFTASIKPICLPTSVEHELSSHVNKKMWLSSWDVTTEGRGNYNKKLKMQHTVVRVADWPGSDPSLHVLARCDKCSGSSGEACGGKPGTPLSSYDQPEDGADPSWTLVGLKTFHYKGCRDTYNKGPVAFTRVSHFVPWIVSNIMAAGRKGLPLP